MRIRTIKPEFWSHKTVSALPFDVQLLALATFSLADDQGYFEADPKAIRRTILAFEESPKKVVDGLEKLAEAGWLEIRSSGMTSIARIIDWSAHQTVDRPSASKLRTIFDSTSPREYASSPREYASSPREGSRAIHEELVKSIPEQSELAIVPPKSGVGASEVFDFWVQTFRRTGKTVFDNKRRSAVERQLKGGFTVEDLKLAVTGCSLSPFHNGDNDRNEQYNDLEFICRNAVNVEKFRAMSKAPPKSTTPVKKVQKFFGDPNEL